MECRNCKSQFEPIEPESSRLYHANRAGFCSVRCDKEMGREYDFGENSPVHAGAFGRHFNPNKIASFD